MISFLVGFLLGGLVGGLIYRNNAVKSKRLLDELVAHAEEGTLRSKDVIVAKLKSLGWK